MVVFHYEIEGKEIIFNNNVRMEIGFLEINFCRKHTCT